MRDCSLQRRFPLDDVLFCSGNQDAKLSEISPEFPSNFWGRALKFLTPNLKKKFGTLSLMVEHNVKIW